LASTLFIPIIAALGTFLIVQVFLENKKNKPIAKEVTNLLVVFLTLFF
jgi:hypothetical protein